jgi:predicted transcriptional regulator
MRRSKLELYEDIICVLAERALTIDGLAFECNTSCVLIQARLEFLVTHAIVTLEFNSENRAFYLLTPRGMAICKTVAITKRLKKLQTTPQASAQSFEAVLAFSENSEEKVKHVSQKHYKSTR